MNEQHTQKLFHDFKEFIHPEKSLTENLMKFGFECSDGWYLLIWSLFNSIQKELKKNPIDNFEVIQVKEKYASLRCYVRNSNETIDNLIINAENESETICEECGQPALICNTGNWIKTICPKCIIKSNREYSPLKEYKYIYLNNFDDKLLKEYGIDLNSIYCNIEK